MGMLCSVQVCQGMLNTNQHHYVAEKQNNTKI